MLPPIVAKLRKLESGIIVEIITTDNASDLLRREADIAIRNFRPTEPELITKKIKDASARFYATPDYIKKISSPRDLKDLNQAEFINIWLTTHRELMTSKRIRLVFDLLASELSCK